MSTSGKGFLAGFGGCLGVGVAVSFVGLCLIGGCGFLIALGAKEQQRIRAEQGADAPAAFTVDESPAPTPAAPTITLAKFNQLQNGITYEQAVQILGTQGTLVSENTISGYHTAMYSWENPGIFQGNMNAMFQNNALMSKSQIGLK